MYQRYSQMPKGETCHEPDWEEVASRKKKGLDVITHFHKALLEFIQEVGMYSNCKNNPLAELLGTVTIDILEREKEYQNILDKIAQGRLNKFYQENVLVEQAFIKDNSKTVGELLKEFNSKHNTSVKISLFHRFHLGDENK